MIPGDILLFPVKPVGSGVTDVQNKKTAVCRKKKRQSTPHRVPVFLAQKDQPVIDLLDGSHQFLLNPHNLHLLFEEDRECVGKPSVQRTYNITACDLSSAESSHTVAHSRHQYLLSADLLFFQEIRILIGIPAIAHICHIYNLKHNVNPPFISIY